MILIEDKWFIHILIFKSSSWFPQLTFWVSFDWGDYNIPYLFCLGSSLLFLVVNLTVIQLMWVCNFLKRIFNLGNWLDCPHLGQETLRCSWEEIRHQGVQFHYAGLSEGHGFTFSFPEDISLECNQSSTVGFFCTKAQVGGFNSKAM